MTQEQKAKAYDELIAKLIKAKEDDMLNDERYCCVIDEIVPELAESEDERIREEILGFIKTNNAWNKEWIAWLEKQKEENYIDRNLVKEEAHRIAWEYSKHYAPLLSKESWCEMAALDMAYWFEKQGESYTKRDVDDAFVEGMVLAKNELEKQSEQKSDPYNGVSFEYNGNIWGMCARDNGVEIIIDGELKAFLSSEKSFIYPIHPIPELAPKSALEFWKDMRLEVYQQASGNRHEPNYSDDATKMFSLNDIDEIFEKIAESSEEKPADKVEPTDDNSIDPHFGKPNPKFHEGEWCIDNKDGVIFQIVKVLNNTYTYKTTEGKEYSCTHYSLENDAKLWNIKDAKNGDILTFNTDTNNDTIVIFKNFYNDNFYNDSSFYSHCYIEDGEFFMSNDEISDLWRFAKFHPATIEQCNILFQKMKEAGYEWDADKKELKKIEQKPVDKVEPKNTPQLTEDDIRIIDNIIMEVNDELVSNKTTLSGTFYQEVLKRFNEVKEK